MDLLSKLFFTQRTSLDERINQFDLEILKKAQKTVNDYEDPVAIPLSNPKRKFVRKYTHGKTDARGLTEAEIAERDLRTCEQKERVQDRARPAPGPAPQFLLPTSTAISFNPYALPPSTAPAALQTTKRTAEYEEDEGGRVASGHAQGFEQKSEHNAQN